MAHEEQLTNDIPEVVLSLELDPAFDRVLDPGDRLSEAVRHFISERLSDVLETLGIPGKPKVEINALDEYPILEGRFLRVIVNGELCRYSAELLQRVHSYVTGVPIDPGTDPKKILALLKGLMAQRAEIAESSLAEFLSLACIEAIKREPSVLLDSAQVATYLASLTDASGDAFSEMKNWPPAETWLRTVLSKVLSLRISIADKRAVVELLREGITKEASPEDVAEDLIAVLSPNVVEIQLPEEYLKQITTSDAGGGQGSFAMMRDGLFYELGLHYPDFQFSTTENLKPNSFSFKVNHLSTMPRNGLHPNQCLVNDTVDRLTLLNIQGTATMNPANAVECSIADSSYKEVAESAGLTTWDQVGYLVLSFAADLRENSASFVHRRAVQNYLDQLGQAFPATVDTVQKRSSIQQLTRVLRSLIAEEISIRNFRLVLELMLDYDYIVADPSKNIIFDDRLPTAEQPDENWLSDPINLASFIRAGMKRYVSHKYTRGGNTLVVYLLAPEIEGILSEHQKKRICLDKDLCDRILEAVRAEVGTLPPSASVPTILTSIEVRPYFREVILHEFPRLPVVCYQELSPDLNIQPIARISLNT